MMSKHKTKGVYNPILNQNILMSGDLYSKWEGIDDDNKSKSEEKKIYPYQSRDMKTSGRVRFAEAGDMKKLNKNIDELEEEILKNYENFGTKSIRGDLCGTMVPSRTVDLYKMKRHKQENINYDYKYLYQINSEALDSVSMINKIIGMECKSDKNKIFVPYIPGYNKIDNIIPHVKYDGIHIVNDTKFVERLKEKFKDDLSIVGQIIYELDYIFQRYDIFKIGTFKNMFKIEQGRRWGINEKQLAKILFDRESELRKIEKSYTLDKIDIDKIDIDYCWDKTKNHHKELINRDSIILNKREDEDWEQTRRDCWYKHLDLKYLPNNKMYELVNNDDRNNIRDPKNYIDLCKEKDFVMSHY